MWKLDETILKTSLIWCGVFILISILFTSVFCSQNLISLFYHVFLFPLYLFVAFSIIFLIRLFKKVIKGPQWILSFVFVLIVFIVSFFLKDFRSGFSLFKYSNHPFSLVRLKEAGCREMFIFLSFMFSSFIMLGSVVRDK